MVENINYVPSGIYVPDGIDVQSFHLIFVYRLNY